MRHPSMLKWYSRMLDFTPGVGDGKAIGEALIGCDLITGQKLGNWRWLGLLGIIGLGNEAVAPFKHVGSYERTILYHGTNAFAAEEIMNNGFRLSRTGLRGPGVYLTPSIEDALHWANRSGGDTIIKIDLDSHELSNLKLFVEDANVNIQYAMEEMLVTRDPSLLKTGFPVDSGEYKQLLQQQFPYVPEDLYPLYDYSYGATIPGNEYVFKSERAITMINNSPRELIRR